MTARTTEVVLELRLGDEPITGTIADATGARRTFWGWLELLAALETVRGGPRHATRAREAKQ